MKNCLVFLAFALFTAAANAQPVSTCVFDPAGIDYATLQNSHLLSQVNVDEAQHLVRANFGMDGVLLAKFYTCNEYGVSANLMFNVTSPVKPEVLKNQLEQLASLFLNHETGAEFNKALAKVPNRKLNGRLAFSKLASQVGFSELEVQITQQGNVVVLGFSYSGN